MKKSTILKEIGKLYKIEEKDIPKTLERFKKEVDEMEKALRSNV